MSALLHPTDTTADRTAPDAPAGTPGIAPSPYLKRKALAVRLVGSLIAVGVAPLLLLLIAAVRVTSDGPGLYRQRRVGLDGREFTILKLRSMRVDAETATGPIWARKKDTRVTPLDRFLRCSHLDELPQIINVVRGEMDLIGPRPERPEMIPELAAEVEGYLDRLATKPGVTGLAQVNLPPDQEVDCVRKKVAADRHYIANATLWMDLCLIAATALRLIGVRYERGAELCGVRFDPPAADDEHGADAAPPFALTGVDLSAVVADPARRASEGDEATDAEIDLNDTLEFQALTETQVDLPPHQEPTTESPITRRYRK